MKTITPQELKRKILDGEKIFIVDVRSSFEFGMRTIDGAINIPMNQMESIQEEISDTDAEIVCICASGARSAFATEVLSEMGYTNVKNLSGGLMNYKL
jgi:rhodanese-related sulfurtransferase